MRIICNVMISAAIAGAAAPAAAQTADDAPGQEPLAAEMSALAAAVGATSLTARSHRVNPGGALYNGEGSACPANTRMVSGACHPGYSDQVRIVNQFPNVAGNTWRCGFSNMSGSSHTAWVYTLCATESRPTPPLVRHDLEVRRYTTTSLTATRSDQIMSDASDVIQTDSGANDIACNVELRRTGGVTAFSTGDGSIDSAAEFSAVNSLPGNVKVVNQINWCGGIGANIIGCAPVPGDSLVVVRFVESLEGILLLHEFGHNQGLSHRNGTDNVMHPSIGASRVGVNDAECTAFRASPAVSTVVGGPVAMIPVGEGGAALSEEDVLEIVQQHYVHGFPVEVGVQLGPDAVPVLIEILSDPEQMEWWPNAVAALGLTGAEGAFEILRAFLEEPVDGTLPLSHYRAKATVPLAMGYYVNRSGDDAALDYMIAAVDPAFWEGQEDIGRAEFHASTAESVENLSMNFVLGLSLAVTDDGRALEALRALQSGSRELAGDLAARADDAIAQAIEEYNKVAAQGLEDYDENRHME